MNARGLVAATTTACVLAFAAASASAQTGEIRKLEREHTFVIDPIYWTNSRVHGFTMRLAIPTRSERISEFCDRGRAATIGWNGEARKEFCL